MFLTEHDHRGNDWKGRGAMPAHSDADLDGRSWFFDNSRDLFLATRHGLIVRVNPAWTAATGWSPEETIGRPFTDFSHKADAARLATQAQDPAGDPEISIACRLRSKAGWWLRVDLRARRGDDGALAMIMRDLTGKRSRKGEAEQKRRAIDLLWATAGALVWNHDPDETGDATPEGAPPGHGGPGDAERLKRVHGEDRAALRRMWSLALAGGAPSVLEYRERRRGGWSWRRAAWRAIRPAARGGWQVMGVTQDITEIAEAREAAVRGQRAAEAASEAKAHFVANISHEIRTPMNGVLGVLHLLKADNLSAEGRRLLDEALCSGQALAELLGDVIDFADIEAGRLALACEPMDVNAAVEGVVGLLRRQAQAKGLHLRTDLDPKAGWIVADPVRLRQILLNLLGNAVKFTDSGGVDVRLTLKGRGARRRLRLEVEDTGIGVPLEMAGRLFEGFDQADNSVTRRHGGTGLGLAISQRLAHLLGGRIGYASLVGEGSRFWIDLPARAVQAADQPAGDGQPLSSLRVLVVEDNPTNRLIATKMLENLGAVVQTADDGAQGVEAARRQNFDLIMMDIQMPVMDGVSAARTIRGLPGAAGRTPILAVTANALAHQVETYRKAGMNGYLAKPFSPLALLRELSGLADQGEHEPAALSA